MKVYDSFGPNPRALRMFLHEKALDLPKADVDLLGAENRRAPYTEKNPGGTIERREQREAKQAMDHHPCELRGERDAQEDPDEGRRWPHDVGDFRR